MKSWFWEVGVRFFKSSNTKGPGISTGPVALFGMVVAVAALVVSMSAMSGFERTLRKAVIETVGSLQVIQRTRNPGPVSELHKEIQQAIPQTPIQSTAFVYVEAVVAKRGKVRGVLVQGLDVASSKNTLKLENRLFAGKYFSSDDLVKPQVLVGKELASQFSLSVGDSVSIVVPLLTDGESSFRRQTERFEIIGIVDLGKHEWNERFVLMPLSQAQKLADIGDRYTGLIVSIENPEEAREASFLLSESLGSQYFIRDWKQTNENLFAAVEIERVALFLVILIIMVVASFNVASKIMIFVLQKTSQISILRALGAQQRQIEKMIMLQGLFLSIVGLGLGLTLGFILNEGFVWIQSEFNILPGSVYKIDAIEPHLRLIDFIVISAVTLGIGILATMTSALRSRKLSIVKGLRYE